jgi:hypothetical protein
LETPSGSLNLKERVSKGEITAQQALHDLSNAKRAAWHQELVAAGIGSMKWFRDRMAEEEGGPERRKIVLARRKMEYLKKKSK